MSVRSLLMAAASSAAVAPVYTTDGTVWLAVNGRAGVGFNCSAYGNGVWVALPNLSGTSGMYSTDALIWNNCTLSLSTSYRGVAYGNGVWVGVGSTTSCITSPDGINWTTRSSVLPFGVNNVAFGGGLFVAVPASANGLCATSPDGVTWTQRALPWAVACTAAVYSGTRWVIVGDSGGIAYSDNGINWTTSVFASDSYTSAAYGAGMFVITYNSTSCATSPNGINWTTRTVGAGTNGWNSVTYGSGQFIMVSTNSTGWVYRSTDGISWVNVNATPQTVTPSFGGYAGARVAYGGGRFFITSTNNNYHVYLTSTMNPGRSWTARTTAPFAAVTSVIWGNNQFLAIQYNNTGTMTSPDGITFTSGGALPFTTGGTTTRGSQLAYGNGIYVFLRGTASPNDLATSPTGATWTQRSSGASAILAGVAFGAGLFVAVGASASCWTSPDGISWTMRNNAMPANVGWSCVFYLNNQFIATSPSNLATSPDGLTWTQRATSIGGGGGMMAYDPIHNYVVMVNTGPNYYISKDGGLTWLAAQAIPGGFSANGLAFFGDKFVTAGPAGKGSSCVYNLPPDMQVSAWVNGIPSGVSPRAQGIACNSAGTIGVLFGASGSTFWTSP